MTPLRQAFAVVVSVAAAVVFVRAQEASPQSAEAALNSARRALAAGQPAAALRTLEPLVARSPGDRVVVELVIQASLSLDNAPRAYAAYDGFVQATGTPVATVLKPIALSELRSIASGAVNDPRLRATALERLARAGDSQAGADLRRGGAWPGPQALLADSALARMGDQSAKDRLAAAIAEPTVGSKAAAVEAIRLSGNLSQAPLLVPLIQHQDPRTRVAAVQALAALGYTGAISAMETLLADPAREVRTATALALTRLGAPSGRAVIDKMLNSPVADVRLLALEADRSITGGQRRAIIGPILLDEEPLNRLKAAEMLAPDEPDAARPVLIALTKNPDFLIRSEAGRVLENLGPHDLALSRSLLADRDPWVRVYAAGAVIAAAAVGTEKLDR